MEDKYDIIEKGAEKMAKNANRKRTTGRFSLENRNRLSWWFPKIPDDIWVPRTQGIVYNEDDLINLLDGKTPEGFSILCERIVLAGDDLGWPLFLRTDYLSGKHNWKFTCCISRPKDIRGHVARLVEESEMADLAGFPTDRWIAREMIPTTPAFTAFAGDMPIVKERRYFVQDAQVVCHHPYWPPDAFRSQPVSVDNWFKLLDEMNEQGKDEIDLLSSLSSKVGAAIGGAWSIDWLWSEPRKQWYLTDMAEAKVSYHWPECVAQKG